MLPDWSRSSWTVGVLGCRSSTTLGQSASGPRPPSPPPGLGWQRPRLSQVAFGPHSLPPAVHSAVHTPSVPQWNPLWHWSSVVHVAVHSGGGLSTAHGPPPLTELPHAALTRSASAL